MTRYDVFSSSSDGAVCHHLELSQYAALRQTMRLLGLPLVDWPAVPAVRGWAELAALTNAVAWAQEDARLRGETLSDRAAVRAAAEALGWPPRRASAIWERARRAARESRAPGVSEGGGPAER